MILAAAVLALAPSSSFAGIACLNDREVSALAVIVSSDASAKALFSDISVEADSALLEPPKPVVEITTQHRLLGDPEKARTQEAVRDFDKALSLALVYRLKGDRRHLVQAKAILLAWAAVNRPTGRPIDETLLEPGIEAYDLIRLALSSDERSKIDDWLKKVGEAEIASLTTDEKEPYGYNHHSFRLKTVGLIAYTVADERLGKWALDGFRRQIGDSLRADGSSLDLTKRDAMWYHNYNLEALVRLALALERAGYTSYDFKASSGASLRKGVAFLLPYATGEKTHVEWVRSQVKFDRERSDNGEKGHQIGQLFDPERARSTVALAEYFEPGLAPLAAKLAGKPGARFPSLRVLLNEVSRRP